MLTHIKTLYSVLLVIFEAYTSIVVVIWKWDKSAPIKSYLIKVFTTTFQNRYISKSYQPFLSTIKTFKNKIPQ